MLRFVYFETLASILKSFGFENLIDFETLKKEYKNKETYGALVIVFNCDLQSFKQLLLTPIHPCIYANPSILVVHAQLSYFITETNK